ncbi:MAG: carboxypeptidase-like regulatory domain-containing protein [Candidatus Bathyarchaeota archaeon]|nr:carboxypeptidase-like regulatory domain-containing protein [Candidatus Bathyarchaeota archaeon]
MKQKAATIALLLLMGTALLLTATSSPQVFGQSPYGLTIFYVTSQGGFEQLQNATIGQPVTLLASTYTANGTYNLYYNDQLVKSGAAEGYFISANFTIPEMSAGTYNFILTDISYNQNTTLSFPLLTSYSVKPSVPVSPAQLQEGNTVNLNVTVTGGKPDTVYNAEIMVALPSPSNSSFTKNVTLTTSSLGTAQVQVAFPDSSFSPSGATTDYAGTYNVYFNRTQGLAQQSFTIGFTDLTQYYRQDTVNVNAVGYQPNQAATLTIEYNNQTVDTQSVTASSQGVITTTWQVPSSAAIGTYTATITTQSEPSKEVPDVQTFRVVGYPVTFTTVNLAGEIVSSILLEATDQASGEMYTGTTNSAGATTISLSQGSVNVEAFWKQVKVGELDITVTGNSSFAVTCQLTDLTVKVQDKNGVVLPNANLNVTYPYTTRSGTTQTGSASGKTGLDGTYTFNSTLPNVTYTIDAYKYDVVFNAGNNTISNLPAQPTVQATIVTPEESLTLQVVDCNNAAIANARVTLIEQASGVFYSVTTDSSGSATLQMSFGQYKVNVYTQNNVLLNETVVDVLSNTQTQLRCVLSNIHVSVKVVDYFGAPISNINVQLMGPEMTTQTETTTADGTVTFNNISGGSVEITAYPEGNPDSFVASNLALTSPRTVTLSMAKFVSLGGALVDTSLLATLLLIIAAILVLLVVEVFRRVGFKLSNKRQI